MSAEDFIQLQKTACLPLRAAGVNFTQAGARGLSTAVTRTSAGLYVATLATGIPAAQCLRTAALTSTSGIIRVEDTSDTVKTIRTFAVDGTTATDMDFDVTWMRVDPPV